MTHTQGVVQTRDGMAISMDWFAGDRRQALVVICPGFFQSKDTPTFQRLCRALAQTVDVLAMDFRGHGRSSGWYTFSARESSDLEAVLSWARMRYASIGIMGFSLGAAIAITTISRHPGSVQSVIAVSGPAAFEEVEFKWWTPEAMRTGLQGLEPGAGCRPGNLWLQKTRPVDAVPRMTTPILFVHGTRDVIIGAEHSRRLYAAAQEPKELSIIKGGSHAEALFRDDPDSFTRLVTRWFARTLAGECH